MNVCNRCARMMFYWKETDEIERDYGFYLLNYVDGMEERLKNIENDYYPVKELLDKAIHELCTCNGTVQVEVEQDEVPF